MAEILVLGKKEIESLFTLDMAPRCGPWCFTSLTPAMPTWTLNRAI